MTTKKDTTEEKPSKIKELKFDSDAINTAPMARLRSIEDKYKVSIQNNIDFILISLYLSNPGVSFDEIGQISLKTLQEELPEYFGGDEENED